MKVLGLDPSLRNWGFSLAEYTNELKIIDTGVIQIKPSKQQYKNIEDMLVAQEIYKQLHSLIKGIDVICVELPVGSKSSRAMVSYATCVALVGVLRTINPNIIVVRPNQIKRYVGSNTASKDDVINWVKTKYPNLKLPVKTKAEHICDSIIAIHVGLNIGD